MKLMVSDAMHPSEIVEQSKNGMQFELHNYLDKVSPPPTQIKVFKMNYLKSYNYFILMGLGFIDGILSSDQIPMMI